MQKQCQVCRANLQEIGLRADAKYCSDSCRVKAHRARKVAPKPPGACLRCGGELTIETVELKDGKYRPLGNLPLRSDAKYCSDSCRVKAHRAAKRS